MAPSHLSDRPLVHYSGRLFVEPPPDRARGDHQGTGLAGCFPVGDHRRRRNLL
jgi:hypothetical protein